MKTHLNTALKSEMFLQHNYVGSSVPVFFFLVVKKRIGLGARSTDVCGRFFLDFGSTRNVQIFGPLMRNLM